MTGTPGAHLARLATREQFIGDLGRALDARRGYAAGKIGETERTVLQYPILLEQEHDPARLRAFEVVLAYKAFRLSGVFPGEPAFFRRFSAAFAQAVRGLDSVGVIEPLWSRDQELLRYHGFTGEPIDYYEQEPDRSLPNDDSRCWLPLLRGRRVLLVCPFAEVLRERATRSTFEAVWRNTGKRWFEPASVEALEFPYGFARATQEQFATALDLLADIRARAEARAYDVALIAAGTLGSMIAIAAKEQGRVGICLGGHLQVLFGVSGQRWRERPEWRQNYFNEAWIELPERYKADPAETDADYW